MAFLDKVKSLAGNLMADPYNVPGQDTVATMATGERRGYRPAPAAKPPRQQKPRANEPAAPGMTGANEPVKPQTGSWQAVAPDQQPMQPNMNYTGAQQSMQQTPFNTVLSGKQAAPGKISAFFGQVFGSLKQGMQKEPVNEDPMQQTGYNQPPMQQTGYNQPPMQQTGYNQPPMQQMGYQPGAARQQTGFQQSAVPMNGYRRNGSQNNGWQLNPPPSPNTAPNGYVHKFGSNVHNGGNTQGAQLSRQQQPTGSNVRYMDPNNFVDETGTAYAMVVRVAQPLSTATCYRMIEFLRNGESVLVNTELITDPAELTRCLDLLFGAAFAMHACYTRIARRSIYLITPGNVKVMPYASVNDMHQRDNARRWPGSEQNNPYDNTWQQRPEDARSQTDYTSHRRYGR